MEEIEALLTLSSMPLLGSIKIRLLIQHFGSALVAIKSKKQELALLPGFGEKILGAWEECLKNSNIKQNLLLIEKSQVDLITYQDPRYPKRLLEIADHPVLLYVKGNYAPKDQRCLAIVGTRHASLYGMEMAKKISSELAHAGFTIISGLARGIDTAAHQGAYESGRTLAILGSGLAHIYPAENEQLADRICARGALISEFPMLAPPDRTHFPQRNRIVSGMSMGTILIEAPLKSGAMLTMNNAFKQGRPLFTLPGRADLDNFRGNHHLIKTKKAQLIENSQDILEFYGNLFPSSFSNSVPPKEIIPLEKEESAFLQKLPQEELSVEDIFQLTKLPISQLNVLLMSLVLKKVIREYPGKIYKKI